MILSVCTGLLVVLVILSGCSNAVPESSISSISEAISEPDNNIITPSIDYSQNMLLITSGGETISTYASVLWDNPWTGEGFLCADFESSVFMGVIDRLSEVTYAEDFSIQYREDISFSYIRIFDENFEQLYNAVDLSYLKELSKGTYFIVVVIKQQGRYIKSVSQYEYSGYECAFKLVVE